MFGSGGDLARIGEPALRIISLSFLLAGVAIVFSSLFQALGEGLLSLAMSVFRQLVVLLPAAWLLSFTGSLDAVWFSFIAEATSILLALGFFRTPTKNKIQKARYPAIQLIPSKAGCHGRGSPLFGSFYQRFTPLFAKPSIARRPISRYNETHQTGCGGNRWKTKKSARSFAKRAKQRA